MDPPSATTPKRSRRPTFGRSHTAQAQLSPPSTTKPSTSTSTVASSNKRSHLDIFHAHHNPLSHASTNVDRPNNVSSQDTPPSQDHNSGRRPRPRSYVGPSRTRPISALTDLGRVASRLTTNPDRDRDRDHIPPMGRAPDQRRSDRSPASTNEPDARRDAYTYNRSGVGRPTMIRPEDVDQARARMARRDDEVRSTLDALNELAHESTRRLDETYYSILEKAGELHAAVASLQQLRGRSAELHEEFKGAAKQVEEDLDLQIRGFEKFDEQKRRIEAFERSISHNRERAKGMSARLETARQRIETWQKRERDWQEKTSKRLRLGWVAAAVVVLALVLALILRRNSIANKDMHFRGKRLPASEWNGTLPEHIVSDLLVASSSAMAKAARATSAGRGFQVDGEMREEMAMVDHPRLMRLDEL